MSQGLYTASLNFTQLNNDQFPLWRVPTSPDYGGVTIVDAVCYIKGTANVTLITMTNVGTPVAAGTIAAAVGGTATAGVPYPMTISNGWVDSGQYVAVQENNIGTPSFGNITITYVMGRV